LHEKICPFVFICNKVYYFCYLGLVVLEIWIITSIRNGWKHFCFRIILKCLYQARKVSGHVCVC
jgi:hypothetical protein